MSWQENLRNVKPYVAGEQPKIVDMVKLNTNENPYGPSPLVNKVLGDVNVENLRLYPNSDSQIIKQELSKYHGVKENQIFIGNGSDEVLALAFLTFFNSSKPILFPDVTYSFYPVYCDLYEINNKIIPLDDNFNIIKEDYLRDNGGIVIPNPNAPTGIAVTVDFIESIVSNSQDSIVIIDEAYIDFGGTSCLSLIDKYDNLLVVQTFSKSRSLAGSRLGVAFGSEEAIARLNDVKNSFNSYPVDYITQLISVASIQDDEYFKDTCQKIINTREQTVQQLEKLGYHVLPSQANFIFVSHSKINIKKLFLDLREVGIIVRHWDKPRISDFLRISIGTDVQMEKLINFLKQYKNYND